MVKYLRAKPVPHTARCKHVRKFAELYNDDLSPCNIEEYVDLYITAKETISASRFKKNAHNLYQWCTRDNVQEFKDALVELSSYKKDFIKDLTSKHVVRTETSDLSSCNVTLSDQLDALQTMLMGIPRNVRISFLEMFLQTQKIKV